MKIAIVGAGFTGLSAALVLSRRKHQITIFEKEATLGGLASGFKHKEWQWTVEKHYHHWFTNDSYAINLIKELKLGQKLFFPPSVTSIFYGNKIYPFNSPNDVITFSPLSVKDRLRTGAMLLYLKLLPPSLALNMENETASNWLKKHFGEKAFQILWQPLLIGKFGKFADQVNMAWFWARIKKRTPKLGYLEGGYHQLLERMLEEIKAHGGEIKFNTPYTSDLDRSFDKIIFTAPSFAFIKTYPSLPDPYKRRIASIPHLHALNLLLITEKKLLKKDYWLNINDRKFPFIALVTHTNLVDKKYYAGKNLTWVGNYLPPGHPFLKMSKEELFAIYQPFLQKINSNFNDKLQTINCELFLGPFAQPVFFTGYAKLKPDFRTPLRKVILANIDMVYPWDRGTNYAIELGFKAAGEAEGFPSAD